MSLHCDFMKKRPFIGRSSDLSFLHERLAAAIHDRAQLVLLTAPAGGGKTQLAERFFEEEANTCLTLRGRCWDNWAAVSYHPLREALQPLCTADSKLPAHLRAFFSTQQQSDAIQPQVLFPALCDLLHGAATDKPLCLFLDDLQWADEGTLEWLDFCLYQQPALNVLVLVTCRSEELAGIERFMTRLHDLHQSGRFVQRNLNPLTREDVAQLAIQIVPDRSWDDALVEHIWNISEGNPLLVIEELRAHSSSGSSPNDGISPLRTRLDSLPNEARDLLCQAAVIGERFAVEPLATAIDREPLSIARALDELWHAHHLIGPDGEGYRFAHARYRELLLESMSPALRRQYHARLTTADVQIAPEQHTYHVVQSSDVRTGVHALLKQGDELRYRASWRDVMRFYNEALWHVKDEGEHPDLLLEIYQRIGDLQLWDAHEPELARGYYEAALRWAREPLHQALLLIRLGEICMRAPNNPRDHLILERAMHLLGTDGPEPLRAWLEIRQIDFHGVYSYDQIESFVDKAQRARDAQELPLELRQVANNLFLWTSIRTSDDPVRTLALHEEFLERLPENSWEKAQYYVDLSHASTNAGLPKRALEHVIHAQELLADFHQPALVETSLAYELTGYLNTHQFVQLRTLAERIVQKHDFAKNLYASLHETLCKTWSSDHSTDGPEWAENAIRSMCHYAPELTATDQRTMPNDTLHHLGAPERVLRRSGQSMRFVEEISGHRKRLDEMGYDTDIVWYFDERIAKPPLAVECDMDSWEATPSHARSEVLPQDDLLRFRALPLQGFPPLNMPRLTRRVSGNFTIECTIQSGLEVQESIYESWRLKGEGKTNPMAVGAGGIVVINNLREKLRLAAHVCEPSEVFMELRNGDQRWTPGRGLLDDDQRPVRLRLERRGALFSAYAANEGDAEWYRCGQVELPHWGEVQVGLWGESPLDLYPAQTERAETRIWDIALECADAMSTPRDEEIRSLPTPSYADLLPDFVAAAPATRALLKKVQRAAQSELPALICGETGTGKELIARALHQCGPRKDGPYVPLNCAAISPHLLESELFGHVRGAFTGAHQNRGGLFEAADGGILFLDEIGDASLELQARLLRVLEDREVRRVGATRAQRVDVRIVAATNRDLEKDIAAGRFRRDLYYRLRGIELTLPPLRQRHADIEPLLTHGLDELARRRRIERPEITQRALALLKNYDWPGNVRELLHEVERAAEAAEFSVIRSFHLAHLGPRSNTESQAINSESEREQLVAALRATGGNVKEAAERLGISRNTIYRRLRRHQVDRQSLT